MSSNATAFSATNVAFSLPPLPYGYAALEPVIDEQTMRLHHQKHHQAYTDGLNAALANHTQWQGLPIEDILRRLGDVPAQIRESVRNHGGGYANHKLFWESLKPQGETSPTADVAARINHDFGSIDRFRQRFEEAGVKHFGSGWVFLTVNPGASSAFEIITLPNQDSPLSGGRIPLLACDLWEHAYYLKYNNRRPEWLKAWWSVVDWTRVAQRLEAAHA